jgi:exosortase H (IPTLxxWG-CTERM-specific)
LNASPGPTARRRSLLFVGRFVGLLIIFYLAVASHPGNDKVIVPFTALIARISATLLQWLGEAVTVNGTEIRSSSFAVQIQNGCNGVETALLFCSAVLAFPAPWKRRAAGLILGFAAIELLNLIRVVSLFWIGAHYPRFFSESHTVIWQSLVVLCGVLLFLVWAKPSDRPPAPATR